MCSRFEFLPPNKHNISSPQKGSSIYQLTCPYFPVTVRKNTTVVATDAMSIILFHVTFPSFNIQANWWCFEHINEGAVSHSLLTYHPLKAGHADDLLSACYNLPKQLMLNACVTFTSLALTLIMLLPLLLWISLIKKWVLGNSEFQI